MYMADTSHRYIILTRRFARRSPGSMPQSVIDVTRLTRENTRLKKEKENLEEKSRDSKSEAKRLEKEVDKLQQELNSKGERSRLRDFGYSCCCQAHHHF